jgi:hypothetical protein
MTCKKICVKSTFIVDVLPTRVITYIYYILLSLITVIIENVK